MDHVILLYQMLMKDTSLLLWLLIFVLATELNLRTLDLPAVELILIEKIIKYIQLNFITFNPFILVKLG